jgi:hypothetical protein
VVLVVVVQLAVVAAVEAAVVAPAAAKAAVVAVVAAPSVVGATLRSSSMVFFPQPCPCFLSPSSGGGVERGLPVVSCQLVSFVSIARAGLQSEPACGCALAAACWLNCGRCTCPSNQDGWTNWTWTNQTGPASLPQDHACCLLAVCFSTGVSRLFVEHTLSLHTGSVRPRLCQLQAWPASGFARFRLCRELVSSAIATNEPYPTQLNSCPTIR